MNVINNLKSKLKSRGSFLLEALLSVVILSVSITLVLQSITASARSVTYTADYTEALFLAENKMFELMEQGFIEDGFKEEDAFPEPFEKYKYSITAASADNSPGLSSEEAENKINLVNLAVSWNSGKRNNTIQFYTYLFNVAK